MKHLFLMAFVSLLLTGCRQRDANPNILPPATQTGENTGGCLVDGKVWVATKHYNQLVATRVSVSRGYSDIYIYLQSVRGGVGEKSDIIIKLKKINLELNKEYSLTQINDSINAEGGSAEYENNILTGPYYRTNNKNYTGKIKITRLDTEKQIVSGLFEFDAIDEDGNVVHIKDGRFDHRF